MSPIFKLCEWTQPPTAIGCDDPLLQGVLDRAVSDLHGLMVDVGEHRIIGAGLPWFSAPFGRDALLTAYSLLTLNPMFAVDALRTLAAFQGKRFTLQYACVSTLPSVLLQMSCNIFTYGSLMFPNVWEQVVRGRYASVKAALEDHARYAIAGESYPGMVAQTGATVEGILYLDIDAADIARLDTFEGHDYRRAGTR